MTALTESRALGRGDPKEWARCPKEGAQGKEKEMKKRKKQILRSYFRGKSKDLLLVKNKR